MYQPLAGYRIMDCSRLLPYQYCTVLIADLGAEVLKIEEPGKGDYGRWADFNNPGEERPEFVMANRNKKSMTLNLKAEKGKEIFKKLAVTSDVVFETFRPGVMEKLGLGYEVINKVNSRIIYCSGTGYGQTGPYRMKSGHDINYISIAGILGSTGMHTGRPVIPGLAIADLAGGGMFTALSIIAALLGREKTGKGQYIDVAMTDVVTSLNIHNIAAVLARRTGKGIRPFDLTGKTLAYNTFETKDGKFIAIGDLEKKFWMNFCRSIGREDLADKLYHRYQDEEETTESLKKIFSSKTRAEWIEFMKEVDDCFTPIYTAEETIEDPHLIARGIITKMKDPMRGETLQLGFPALYSGGLNCMRSPAPSLGEHTVETLNALGYEPEEIKTLKENGVV
jgi:crotonobetainyl-CoA:carnitine CoA-transferase CaiB-like acyl-CoA transferase